MWTFPLLPKGTQWASGHWCWCLSSRGPFVSYLAVHRFMSDSSASKGFDKRGGHWSPRFFFAQSRHDSHETQFIIETQECDCEILLDAIMAEWRIRFRGSAQIQARTFAAKAARITRTFVFLDALRAEDGYRRDRSIWLYVGGNGKTLPRVLCGHAGRVRHPGFIKRP